MSRYPIATYARSLNPRELQVFLGLPMLRFNPLGAIDRFEAKYRRRVR